MEIVRGRSVLKRTAVGRLQYYEKEEPSVVRRQVEDTERELSRYERALEQAEKELEALYERALGEAGADSAAVFMGHRMLLKDEEYRNSVTRAITGERVNAAFAVETVGDELCRLFLEMEDEYLRARAADIWDVSDRLLRILEEEDKGGGRCGRGPALSEPVILAARDLAPSETVLLDKKKILGVVTEQGSANSHTAILARTMEIPALVSVPVAREWDGRLAAIDGEEGILYVDPDPDKVCAEQPSFCLEEEAPHIMFTPLIRAMCQEIVGDETNPLLKAKRIYEYVTDRVRYSYVRRYSTILNIPEYAAVNQKGDCGVQAVLFITLCRCAGVPARWQSGLFAAPYDIGGHDWAQFYVAPYGWLYADLSFGGSAHRLGNEERRAFYFGNLDPFRMPANLAFQHEFIPPKQFMRNDPTDNQYGECEYNDRALTLKEYSCEHTMVDIHQIG